MEPQKRERLELYSTLRKPQVREFTREDGSKAKRFEGYAIVFNEPSVVMVDWWEDKIFREIILPEAISQEMLDTSDVTCTAYHNREKLLARHHADGTGTLSLVKDEIGVFVSFEFPNGPTGKDIEEGVLRGDLPGMSFSFYECDYSYTDKKGEDGIFERTIDKIDSIFEVTVASSPAYPATTANCREAWQQLKGITDTTEPDTEAARREAEEKAKAEKEKREKETLARSSEDRQREIELQELENQIINNY